MKTTDATNVPNWKPITHTDPPTGSLMYTKIDDADGPRSIQMLRRRGRPWFFPDGFMYVYYEPTHYAPSPDASDRPTP